MHKEFCCEAMRYHTTNHCEIHDDPFDCPDRLVCYNEKARQFGLIIHDGGKSYVGINHCPWCGKALTKSTDSKRHTKKKRLSCRIANQRL